MNTYQDRNRLLKKLGYKSYKEYLESPKWFSDVRPRAMLRSGGRCMLCWGTATLIHHLGYGRKVLLGIDLSPLIPLCGRCHWTVEHDSDGNKYTVTQSQKAYYRLRRQFRQSKEFAALPEDARRFLLHLCLTCGDKAKKGSRYCTPCFRTKQGRPVKTYNPTSLLPRCKGLDCPCQARKESEYCGFHSVDPNVSYNEYKNFLRRAGRAGIRVSVSNGQSNKPAPKPMKTWYSR